MLYVMLRELKRKIKVCFYIFVQGTWGLLLLLLQLQFVPLAQVLVLMLSPERHHVPLKDVASLWSVSKVLHVVQNT